ENGGHELCSGFLLDATTFVTAAHCFPGGATVQVTFDANATSASKFYKGVVHVMPGFCLSCAGGTAGADTDDVAVVVLKGNGAPQSRYAQLPPVGYDDSLQTGQAIDVVGYGVSGIHAGTV